MNYSTAEVALFGQYRKVCCGLAEVEDVRLCALRYRSHRVNVHGLRKPDLDLHCAKVRIRELTDFCPGITGLDIDLAWAEDTVPVRCSGIDDLICFLNFLNWGI